MKKILIFILFLFVLSFQLYSQSKYSGKLITVYVTHIGNTTQPGQVSAIETDGVNYFILDLGNYITDDAYRKVPFVIDGNEYQEGDSIEVYGTIFPYDEAELGIKVETIKKIVAENNDNFYWYKGEKIFLEEVPTKKYLVVNSSEDTLRIKNGLTSEGINMLIPFEKYSNGGLNFHGLPPATAYFAFIEGNTFSNFMDDEAILYEASFYTTHCKWLMYFMNLNCFHGQNLSLWAVGLLRALTNPFRVRLF